MAATVNDVRCTILPNRRVLKMAEVEAQVESKTRYEPVVRPGPVRRATSESYYEPFPDDAPPPDDE
jgi:hypothetical protein